MKLVTIKGIAAVTGCLASLSLAQATPITVGQSGQLSLEVEPLGATLLATTNVSFSALDLPYSQDIFFSGSLVSSVWAGDTSNPYGGLTFTYQLSNDSSSRGVIESFNLKNYFGFSTDVGYNGVGIVPKMMGRADTRMTFVFGAISSNDPWLHPGLVSSTLVIQTDSQVWDIGNAFVVAGMAWTDNCPILAPSAVPEPAAFGLAMIGLASFAVRKRF